MDNFSASFRTAMFGGFNKEDVISYIEKIKNEFFDYKKESEATISRLNQKIKDLEATGNTANKEADIDLTDSIAVFRNELEKEKRTREHKVPASAQIDEAANQLKQTADNICDCLNDFMDKLSENSIAVTFELPEEKAEQGGNSSSGIASLLSSIVSVQSGEGKETKDEKQPSLFSQLVSSVIESDESENESEPQEEAVQADKQKSMLDDLLPSALFTNK